MLFQDFQKEMAKQCQQEILDFYNHTNGSPKKFHQMIKLLSEIANTQDNCPTDGQVYQFMTLLLSKQVDELVYLSHEEMTNVIMGMTEKTDSADNLKMALKKSIE
eukprot:gene9469-1675_t